MLSAALLGLSLNAIVADYRDTAAAAAQARSLERFRDAPPSQVDPNADSGAVIATLPRIGGGLAGRIVAYRRWIGRFRTPTDLLKVPGMGENLLADLEEHLTVEK